MKIELRGKMTHKFDPINKTKLDNEWRRQNLPPTQTLEKLGLMPSDIVADIGCGIGYFSVPAAEMLTNRNKVFALDTSDEMLAEVEKRALIAGVSNVVAINTEEYDLKLPDDSITVALLVNVLHEIEDKQRFIREVNRVLKPEGRILIIEWKKEIMEMGPKITHRIGSEEVVELFNSDGFSLCKEMQFAGVFYGLVFLKGEVRV
jgi:ubiquinone/menaquinone biosynthesis C-methylase UbiE